MFDIVHFRAFWHPGHSLFGISVRLKDGRDIDLRPDTPQEFVALLALLNGPNPQLTGQGHIVSSR